MLLIWGAISFHNLPVEAYPDVANNYVQVITQWPGHAAEEVEQQVTIPIEIVMNGIPHLEHLRSTSLFGLSSVMLIFDDQSENDWNRQKVLERLSQVTLPDNLQPQIGPDYSPVGQIYWYTLKSTNPQYDLMELKSLEDWVLEKQFKSVPNVVDVASFGGITREYQVRVDPDKLVAYGLTIGQVEQQLANNNVNAGGSFVEAGLQQINVRAVGPDPERRRHRETVVKTQNGTPMRSATSRTVTQGPKIRLGQIGKAIHRADGKIIDNDDVVEGIVLLRKGANADATLDAIHDKVKELNEHILPPGVKIVPFLDRSNLVHYTTHTVLHNLTEGILLVAVILFLFLGNVRGALIVALTIPFSLLFASICLSLNKIPANLLSLGALDFGMVVEGAVVMVENIVRYLSHRESESGVNLTTIRDAAHEVQRPVFYSIGIIITAYLPIFTLQRVEGRLFKPMAWTVSFALLGSLLFSMLMRPGAVAASCSASNVHEWHNPVMIADDHGLSQDARSWAIRFRWVTVSVAAAALAVSAYLRLQRRDRLRIPAASGRRRHLGARHAGAQHRAHRRRARHEPGAPHSGVVSGSDAGRVSQVGRPDDGTDTTGFFNTEYFVDLKPKEQWRPVFHQNKEALIAAMDRELEKIPGALWNFSQPIADNMEEAVSGVKGQLAIKIYGDDLKTLEAKGEEIVGVMQDRPRHRGPGPVPRDRPAQPGIRRWTAARPRATASMWPTCRTPSRRRWAARP